MSAYKPNSTTTITEHEAGQIGGGRDTVDSPGRGRDGSNSLFAQRCDEPADQKRRPAGCVPACRRETRFGFGAQPRRDQPGYPAGRSARSVTSSVTGSIVTDIPDGLADPPGCRLVIPQTRTR
jgi:hypothetical protein